MKKLMIAAAIVCAAAISQAADFSWATGGTKWYGVTAATVGDNGDYAAATSGSTDRADKVLSLTYTFTLFEAGTSTKVGTATGDVEFATLGKFSWSAEIAGAAQNTTYDYTIVFEGDQTNLSGRGAEAEYDYSAATVSTTYNGTITTALMGVTAFEMSKPSTWTVSGIVAAPEPTSGLLLLLGVAGLALKRKQK